MDCYASQRERDRKTEMECVFGWLKCVDFAPSVQIRQPTGAYPQIKAKRALTVDFHQGKISLGTYQCEVKGSGSGYGYECLYPISPSVRNA